jgi:hypothetical protein
VICDDLLQDDRKVSVVLNYDDPYQVESILAAYGYRSYQDRGLTYWCGSSDPFAGAMLELVPGRYAGGPFVLLSYNGARYHYQLASLASYNDLTVTFVDCAYQLKRRNGRVVRYLTDQQCLADLAHRNPHQGGVQEILEAAKAPQPTAETRPAPTRTSVPYDPPSPSFRGPATASAAIASAPHAQPFAPGFQRPGA